MSGLETGFDSNLPYGTEDESLSANIATHADVLQNNNDDQPLDLQYRTNEDSTDELFNDPTPDTTAVIQDGNDSQQPLNYEQLALDYSEDEGVEQAFDRSWSAHLARKPPPRKKKSPRRSQNSDGDDYASPRTKKPRKSLFGGPVEESGVEEERQEDDNDQNGGAHASGAAKPNLRHRMSSLNLDQDVIQEEDSQDDAPVDLRFGLGSVERHYMPPVSSRAPSEDSFILPPDDQPAYGLRQNIDRVKSYTYVDQDKTGDYDPSNEAKLQAQKEKRAKAAKSAKKKSINKGKGKEKAPKEHIIKCIVRLRFKGFGNVRNYTDDQDNWPAGWSDFDTDDEEAAKEYRNYYRLNTPGVDMQTGVQDPREEVDDLTGYPAARGCMQCRENNQDCSMVEGGTFPCDQCEEDEQDCKLIIPPTEKGRCEQCEADGEAICSFEEDAEQEICDHCYENQYICNPSPPLNYKTPRISLDEHLYGPNRKHISCTFCRSEKKHCSLKKKTDKPPCKYCKKHGIGCNFYDLPKAVVQKQVKSSDKQKAKSGSTRAVPEVSTPNYEIFTAADLADLEEGDDEAMIREPTPEIQMEDEAGNEGMLTKIKTCFAHPVQFNVAIAATEDCNFCEMPMFGFVGHFERTVHVIRWYSGLGYTEVGGGHCGDKGPTTMCTVCTTSRIQIMICPAHEFQRITDDSQDFEVIGDDLLSAEPGSPEVQYQLQRWCSMCFSPATSGCALPQPSLTDEDKECVGCGLRLCDKCLATLQDVYAWNMDTMVEDMDLHPKISEEDEATGELEGKPRADVGFLSIRGLIMKTLEAEGGGAMEVEADM
ncbi:hypothetical protein BDU57DRAFT_448984 [Ampelomyces quisqualis]|uniref:Zn(2)-C6 fungal-type domain-containing protein n=1 Tax=Ampelomyces quisqualis TaxID=50730 RepID=A0A6A5QN89_AMPQU|nr:hypothetical protein BDU57DRAFT_448984 [Ampelomyces quisqualis]